MILKSISTVNIMNIQTGSVLMMCMKYNSKMFNWFVLTMFLTLNLNIFYLRSLNTLLNKLTGHGIIPVQKLKNYIGNAALSLIFIFIVYSHTCKNIKLCWLIYFRGYKFSLINICWLLFKKWIKSVLLIPGWIIKH